MSPLIDNPLFSTEQVADVAGLSVLALRAQLRRDIVLAPGEREDDRHPGTGRSRRWSARRVIHVVLTQQLARLGLAVGPASKLALQFTDMGDSRLPCQLLPDETVFRVIFPRDGGEAKASVDSLSAIQKRPFGVDNKVYGAVALVDLDDLLHRTLTALGLPLEIAQ